eukprot:TRINITY_DN54715_c0_g1_i1.p1 TRINITY_DN54715_c0_g1~~TRINITY_DN54715_c0_g1_i1.p1  ORF type:complete len:105 (+),score=6.11 TRINITY_DN54715_c0_g1_i1:18-332(+)
MFAGPWFTAPGSHNPVVRNWVSKHPRPPAKPGCPPSMSLFSVSPHSPPKLLGVVCDATTVVSGLLLSVGGMIDEFLVTLKQTKPERRRELLAMPWPTGASDCDG